MEIFNTLSHILQINLTLNFKLKQLTNVKVYDNDSVTLVSDNPMFCCMLGTKDNCLVHKRKEYWCGLSFRSNTQYVYTIIQLHVMVILSVISLVAVLFWRSKNTNKFATTISFHIADLFLVGNVLIIVIKDHIFGYLKIHNKSGGKYMSCNVAASLQLAGLLGHSIR